jgi:hypothetical protein
MFDAGMSRQIRFCASSGHLLRHLTQKLGGVFATIIASWWEDYYDMLRGAGFGAHDPKHGHRLPRQLELPPPGLARRFAMAGGGDRSGPVCEHVAAMIGEAEAGNQPEPERLPAVEGNQTGKAGDFVNQAPLAASSVEKKRGRPKVEGERPWEAEGISRRTWERRRKGGGGSGL